ncbi:hypothetical protein Dimus_031945, partial [Dionaea muscipula]
AIPHTSSLSHAPFLYVRFSVSVSFSSSLYCLLASSTAKTTANQKQNRRQKLLNELGEDKKKLRAQERQRTASNFSAKSDELLEFLSSSRRTSCRMRLNRKGGCYGPMFGFQA